MTNTEGMRTLKAEDVPDTELDELEVALDNMLNGPANISEDSELYKALRFILDTLKAGRDVTIIAEPNPEDYVLLGGALSRAEDFGNRYGAGPR